MQSRSFSTGQTFITVTGEAAPGIHYPTAVCQLPGVAAGASKAGTSKGTELVVADTSSRLFVVSTQGVCRKTLGTPGSEPEQFGQGISAVCTSEDGSWIFAADTNNHRIHKIRAIDSTVVAIGGSMFGRGGSGRGELLSPHGLVAFGESVFVSDSHNHRIAIFSMVTEGSGPSRLVDNPMESLPFLASFGTKGRTKGCLQYPRGLAIFKDPLAEGGGEHGGEQAVQLFVADARNHRVQIFTPSGKFLRSVGGAPFEGSKLMEPPHSAGKVSGSDLFELPSNLAVSAEHRRLFVADARAITCLTLDELAPCFVLALSQPARLLSAKPPSHSPFALCMVPPASRNGPVLLYVAEYGEHAIREVTLTPDDLRHEVEPHDFWQPAEKPGILDVLRQRRR